MAAKKTSKVLKKSVKRATGGAKPAPVALRLPTKTAAKAPTKAEALSLRPSFEHGAKTGIAADMPQKKRLDALRAVAHKINTTFKSPVVVTADEAHTNTYLRRPCGIMQLDLDTGGGLPAGKLTTIVGPNQSGKTTLMYYYYAMHQRLYGADSVIANLCTEGNVDYFQARDAGWVIPLPWEVIESRNAERIKLGMPKFSEEEVAELRREVGVNHLIENLGTCEEYLDVLQNLLKSNLYGIIGLDSYEGLMPSAEAQLETLEKFPQQAARASLIGRFMQHYGPITRDPAHFTTFIMTGQVRHNRKKGEAPGHLAKYIQDWAEAMPDSVKHWRRIAFNVWGGAKISNGKKDEDRESVGKVINWMITKGTEGAHDNVRGETEFFYDARGFNLLQTVFHAGLKYGVIRDGKNGLTFYPSSEPDDYLDGVPSSVEFIKVLREDVEKEMQVRRAITHAAGKHGVYI
jgi:RecA/RadA recombinase